MLPQKLQLLLMIIVLVAGYYDIRYRRIPNWLVLPALLVGVGLNAFLYGTAGLKQAGLGLGLAMLVYFPLYLLHGMGAGDVKLMAAIGALVGWANWLLIFILSGLLGGVLALVLMLAKGRFRRTLWNTGYLMWEMLHFRAPHMRHEELDVRNPRAFTLPHGAVIALACILYAGIATFVAA